MAQTKAKVNLETATGVLVDVFRSETDCTNGDRPLDSTACLCYQIRWPSAQCPVPGGGRSTQAAKYLTSIGFTDVVNLEGGMLAAASSNEGA